MSISSDKSSEKQVFVVSCPGIVMDSVQVPGFEPPRDSEGTRLPGTVYLFWWALAARPEDKDAKGLELFTWEVMMPTAAQTQTKASSSKTGGPPAPCEGMKRAARVHRVGAAIPCLRNTALVEAGDELFAALPGRQ